jgi:hypothetical protein
MKLLARIALTAAALVGTIYAFGTHSPGFLSALVRLLGGLLLLFATIVGGLYLLDTPFKTKDGKLVNPAGGIIAICVLGWAVVLWAGENGLQKAQRLGFSTVSEYDAAVKVGAQDKASYDAYIYAHLPPAVRAAEDRKRDALEQQQREQAAVQALAPAPAQDASPSAPETSPPSSNWSYSTSQDPMRDTTTRFASVTSDNELSFGFPYWGGTHGALQLRSKAGRLDVILSVDRGQFACSGFLNESVAVKFDSGPVREYSCESASDGSSNILFLVPAQHFVKELRHAKTVVIEAEFYQEGKQQLAFTTSDLNW